MLETLAFVCQTLVFFPFFGFNCVHVLCDSFPCFFVIENEIVINHCVVSFVLSRSFYTHGLEFMKNSFLYAMCQF